ncbi:hypothetical protein JCM8115_006989 [Rhodotorula mucilaginosa]
MPKTRSSNRTARDDRPSPALDPATAVAAAGPSSSRGTTSNPTRRKVPADDDGEDLETIPRSSTRRIANSPEVEGAPRRSTKRRKPDIDDDDELFEGLPSRLPPVPKPLRSRRHRTIVEAVPSAPGAYPNAVPSTSRNPFGASTSRDRVFFAAGRDSPSLSPSSAAAEAFDLGLEGGGPDRDDDDDYKRLSLLDDDREPADRLTRLPRELLQHIFSYIAAPESPPPPAAAARAGVVAPLGGGGGGAGAGGGQARAVVPAGPNANNNANNNNVAPPPSAEPHRIDRHSLALAARTCRQLLSHARLALYRDLHVETRVQAHALHRALHANEMSKDVRHVTANVELMARTSSQWTGWFIFHSMHSLCGIIGSCRNLLTLTLYMPIDSAAWAQSLCQSLVDLKSLHTLTKDLYETGKHPKNKRAVGKKEGMDVGWVKRKKPAMWAVSQLVKPLGTLKGLHTLRICGLSSDSSTLPAPPPHSLRLTEVVLVDVNITNMDLMQVLGDAKSLTKLTLWGSSLLSKRGLAHVLRKCPSLVDLRVGGSWFGAKEEDDKHFPLNDVLPILTRLKILHISGSLISPSALEIPTVALSHLFVQACAAWTPSAVHASLSKMSHDPPAVCRLTLPAMAETASSRSNHHLGRRHNNNNNNGASTTGQATAQGWNETWRFTVRKTGEAKGCIVEASMSETDPEIDDGRPVASDSESD